MIGVDLATAAVTGLSGGAVGGAVTALGLLRYADTTLVGWLLGMRRSKTLEPSANVVEPPPQSEPPHRGCTSARARRGEASGRPTRLHRLRGQQYVHDTQSSDRLTPPDHEALARELQVHATAMRSQVSAYADLLAGDDEVLRARLRRFENGGV